MVAAGLSSVGSLAAARVSRGVGDEPRNEELEAALLERPFDEGVLAVYADWLSERGAARGELILLQRARRHAGFGPVQRAAEAKVVFKHKRQLLPQTLAQWVVSTHADRIQECTLEWQLGFVRAAQLPLWLAAETLVHPSFRFLLELHVADIAWNDPVEPLASFAVSSPILRKLRLDGSGNQVSTRLGDLAGVLERTPSLSELEVRGGFDMSRVVPAPALKRLASAPEDGHAALLDAIADGSFAGLAELTLVGAFTDATVARLSRALAALPRLERLRSDDAAHAFAIAAIAQNAAPSCDLALPAADGPAAPGPRVRVRLAKRPAWGTGEIVSERDGKAVVEFADGERRTVLRAALELV
jgi:uncharacterized protein (TIGR02996 family)